jgi:hypothetical protein
MQPLVRASGLALDLGRGIIPCLGQAQYPRPVEGVQPDHRLPVLHLRVEVFNPHLVGVSELAYDRRGVGAHPMSVMQID